MTKEKVISYCSNIIAIIVNLIRDQTNYYNNFTNLFDVTGIFVGRMYENI